MKANNHILGASGSVFVFTLVVFIFGVLFWGIRSEASDGSPLLIIVLFGLPLVVQLIGLVVLYWKTHERQGVEAAPAGGRNGEEAERKAQTFHQFCYLYLFTMFVCGVSHLPLWLFFIFGSGGLGFSLLALFFILLLVLVVVVLTLAITRSTTSEGTANRRGWLRRGLRRALRITGTLKSGVSQEPVLAILLFFTVFLVVSYLFGFAFAFHDRGEMAKARAKREAQSKGTAYIEREGFRDVGQGRALYKKALFIPPSSQVPPEYPERYHFEFDSLRAILATESNATDSPKDTPKYNIAAQRKRNDDNLESLISKLIETTGDDRRVRVVLIGRADDRATKSDADRAMGTYQSNYELAEARVRSVQYRVLEGLRQKRNSGRGIEWLSLSESNESQPSKLTDMKDSGSEPPGKKRKGALGNTADNQRIVDARIEPVFDEPATLASQHTRADSPEVLTLMDYIYFANYTITTTGYGDIIPVTPYAKFLCSVANICEVFFLVVFFNALLSLSGRGVPKRRQPKA